MRNERGLSIITVGVISAVVLLVGVGGYTYLNKSKTEEPPANTIESTDFPVVGEGEPLTDSDIVLDTPTENVDTGMVVPTEPTVDENMSVTSEQTQPMPEPVPEPAPAPTPEPVPTPQPQPSDQTGISRTSVHENVKANVNKKLQTLQISNAVSADFYFNGETGYDTLEIKVNWSNVNKDNVGSVTDFVNNSTLDYINVGAKQLVIIHEKAVNELMPVDTPSRLEITQ